MASVIFLNGTVGAGKTTTMLAMSDLLQRATPPIVNATIDMDQITCLNPPPPDDPFCEATGVRNLHRLAGVYKAAGAGMLLVAGVIESYASAALYAAAVKTSFGVSTIVRLDCGREEGERRLRARHAGDWEAGDLEWHLKRRGELDGVLRKWDLDNFAISSEGLTPEGVARAVLEAVLPHDDCARLPPATASREQRAAAFRGC